ncbi:hypothetical protein HDU98_006673 [Podochytrium sp. JEL0797]|nr:hypothetical protein HDU98_006673 [Podochytrium sp. JEL0797]
MEGACSDEKMIRITNILFNCITLITGTLWITFTFNVFCPQLHFEPSTETFLLSFLEWSYFGCLSLLLICLSKTAINETRGAETGMSGDYVPGPDGVTFDSEDPHALGGSSLSLATSEQTPLSSLSALSSGKIALSSLEAMKRLESRWSLKSTTPIASPSYGGSSPTRKSGTSPGYMTPYSRPRYSPNPVKSAAVSPGIFARYAQQDSDMTLLEEIAGEEMKRRGGTKGKEGAEYTWGWSFLVDSCAFLIVSVVYVGHWADVVAGRGPVMGVVTALLVTFSAVILLQVGVGVFNFDHVSEEYRPFMSRKLSIPLSFAFIIIALAATLSNSFGFIIVASLWPIALLLCLSSTGRCTTEDRMTPLLESMLSPETVAKMKRSKDASKKIAIENESAVVTLASPLTSRRNGQVAVTLAVGDPAFSPLVKRFLKSVCIAFIGHAFCISAFCGLELPVAITACLFSILYLAGLTNNVGKKSGRAKFVGIVQFWAVSLVGLAVLVAVSVLPLYAFPLAKGFSKSMDKVGLLYTISDNGVTVDSINRAISAVALQGFYISINVNCTQLEYDILPSVFMFIFGITGFASCVASFSLVGQSATPYVILMSVALNVASLVGAGYVIDSVALSSNGISGSNLALTGAALFTAAKVASTSLAAARHSRIALELENMMVGLALLVFLGWITVAVGMGRFYIDIGSISGIAVNRGMGPVGSVVSTAVTSVMMLISCWFNLVPLISATTGLTVVALMFCGGLLGDTSLICFGSESWCSSQQLAMFAGGIISILGLAASIAVRFWSFETEESKRQKLLLKYQSAYSEKLRRKRAKIAIQNTSEEEAPILLPTKPVVFVHISEYKESWRLWKAGSTVALFGWLLFLGGFGALATRRQDMERN